MPKVMSTWPGPEPLAACPDPFNLAGYVLARARDLPDKIALQILSLAGDEPFSFGRLERAVRAVSHGLGRLGLAQGDRVLLRLGNSVDFPLAFLGAAGAGLLPVVTPAGLSVPEVTRLADEVRPALIIAGAGLALPAPLAAPVLGPDDLTGLAQGPEGRFSPGAPDRPGYLVYTSGTSGRPRAVVHAHRAVWARRSMWQGWYDLTEQDRMLHAGALNWTFTLGTGLFDPWAVGATALVPEAGIAPEDLPRLLGRYGVTLFAAAPGVYRKMLKSAAPLALPHLRHGLTAGERLPDATRAAWMAATGRPVYEAYGLSECSTPVSCSPYRPAPPGVTGFVQPGRNIAVLGPDAAPAPDGTAGVIAVHRDDPGLFLDYFANPEERAARMAGDWFVTGDHGVMDAQGALTVLGREDDMMNAGGFRVSPIEVEEALSACAEAGQVAVVEVATATGSTTIAAFYTGSAEAARLAAHAETCLAPYKRPRIYRHMATLPLAGNGKINRRALREEGPANT